MIYSGTAGDALGFDPGGVSFDARGIWFGTTTAPESGCGRRRRSCRASRLAAFRLPRTAMSRPTSPSAPLVLASLASSEPSHRPHAPCAPEVPPSKVGLLWGGCSVFPSLSWSPSLPSTWSARRAPLHTRVARPAMTSGTCSAARHTRTGASVSSVSTLDGPSSRRCIRESVPRFRFAHANGGSSTVTAGLYVNTGFDPTYTDSNHTTAGCASKSAHVYGTLAEQAAWAAGCSEAEKDFAYATSVGISNNPSLVAGH